MKLKSVKFMEVLTVVLPFDVTDTDRIDAGGKGSVEWTTSA
jgi:hypothetical protein